MGRACWSALAPPLPLAPPLLEWRAEDRGQALPQLVERTLRYNVITHIRFLRWPRDPEANPMRMGIPVSVINEQRLPLVRGTRPPCTLGRGGTAALVLAGQGGRLRAQHFQPQRAAMPSQYARIPGARAAAPVSPWWHHSPSHAPPPELPR